MKKQIFTKSGLVCKRDGWKTTDIHNKSGALSSHFKEKGYGEFKKEDFEPFTDEIEYYVCDKTGKKFKTTAVSAIANHIENTLKYDLMEYLEKNPHMEKDMEASIKRYNKNLQTDANVDGDMIQSPLDGKYYHRLLSTHLRKYGYKSHKEFLKDYPNCKMCSTKSSIKAKESLKSSIVTVIPVVLSNKEVDIINGLIFNREFFRIQEDVDGKRFDFFFPNEKVFIELESSFHHSGKVKNTTFTELQHRVNDFEKNIIIEEKKLDVYYVDYEIIRYWKEEEFTFAKLLSVATKEKSFQTVLDDEPILTKDYLEECRKKYDLYSFRLRLRKVGDLIKQLCPKYIMEDGTENPKWDNDTLFVAAVEHVCGFNENNEVYDVTIENVKKFL